MSWGLACIIAIILMFKLRSEIELFQKSYWDALLQPWKIIIFLIAFVGIVAIAPYSRDPTWDYLNSIYMSILTYSSAPWVIGILFRTSITKINYQKTYIAICLWMFSISWSYDLYLVIRDGFYPVTWYANIFASSIFYISAGIMWNLEYIEDRGVILGFMDQNWPATISSKNNFKKLFLYVLPFIIIVASMIILFLYDMGVFTLSFFL